MASPESGMSEAPNPPAPSQKLCHAGAGTGRAIVDFDAPVGGLKRIEPLAIEGVRGGGSRRHEWSALEPARPAASPNPQARNAAWCEATSWRTGARTPDPPGRRLWRRVPIHSARLGSHQHDGKSAF